MKKNILLITGIYPPDIGGPSIFVEEIIKYLKNKKDQYKVITLQDEKYISHKEKNIIKLRRNQNKLIRTLNLIFTIRKYSKKIDSILCCGLIFETYISQIGLRNKTIYRFVSDSIWDKYLSNNTNIYIRDKSNFFIDLLFFFRNKILNSFDLIITPSNYLKKYYLKKIGNRKLKVISNFASINKNIYSFKENKNKINLKNKLNFVVISRLVKFKNIDILIKAFMEFPEYNLHIYGTGPEETNFRKYIKNNIFNNIYLHGHKKRDKVLKALFNCDCFIQISSTEGMSFSILEALFFKKPMLLSNIEANFETAKSAAIYVNPKSYEQVCKSLKLFKSDKIKRLISNNANYIYTNFYDKKLTLDSYYNEL
tara:strand:+ start:7449 stop:8549 length:1101 start_codon:yes stop_codon:yes gene_type:complete